MVAHHPGRPNAAGLAIPAAVENLIAIFISLFAALLPQDRPLLGLTLFIV